MDGVLESVVMWFWGALKLTGWGSSTHEACSSVLRIYHSTQGRWLVFLQVHSLPFPLVIDSLCFSLVRGLSEQSLHFPASLDVA